MKVITPHGLGDIVEGLYDKLGPVKVLLEEAPDVSGERIVELNHETQVFQFSDTALVRIIHVGHAEGHRPVMEPSYFSNMMFVPAMSATIEYAFLAYVPRGELRIILDFWNRTFQMSKIQLGLFLRDAAFLTPRIDGWGIERMGAYAEMPRAEQQFRLNRCSTNGEGGTIHGNILLDGKNMRIEEFFISGPDVAERQDYNGIIYEMPAKEESSD